MTGIVASKNLYGLTPEEVGLVSRADKEWHKQELRTYGRYSTINLDSNLSKFRCAEEVIVIDVTSRPWMKKLCNTHMHGTTQINGATPIINRHNVMIVNYIGISIIDIEGCYILLVDYEYEIKEKMIKDKEIKIKLEIKKKEEYSKIWKNIKKEDRQRRLNYTYNEIWKNTKEEGVKMRLSINEHMVEDVEETVDKKITDLRVFITDMEKKLPNIGDKFIVSNIERINSETGDVVIIGFNKENIIDKKSENTEKVEEKDKTEKIEKPPETKRDILDKEIVNAKIEKPPETKNIDARIQLVSSSDLKTGRGGSDIIKREIYDDGFSGRGEGYKNDKPYSFIFPEGEIHEYIPKGRDWKYLVDEIIRLVRLKHPEIPQGEFENRLRNIRIGKRESTICLACFDDINQFGIVAGESDIWQLEYTASIFVCTKRTSDQMVELCYEIINEFGYSDNDLRIKTSEQERLIQEKACLHK